MRCLSIITVLCILASFQAAFAQNANTCTRSKIRKEIKSLTAAEKQDFIDAINKMKTGGVYDRFTAKHLDGLQYHGTMWFYPFHRALLNEFEDEMLRNSGGVIQGLPYWDEGADFNAPLETPLFTSQYMGSVTVGQNQCLQAPFEGWMHDGQCVAREVRSATISSGRRQQAWIVPAQTLAAGLSQLTTFEDFSTSTEGVPHGTTHVWIGGNMADVQSSPADPMFWLHHNYIDFIWATWQRSRNGQNFLAFANDGTTPQTVVPLSQNTLADVQNFNTRLCYDFQVSASATAGRRLSKRQTPSQPITLPFLASMTDDDIKRVLPKIKVEDYRKAEETLNNITTRINEELQKGKPLSSFQTLAQMYQEGSVPETTNSAGSLHAGSAGMIISIVAGALVSFL
ncbi:hypothetical protein BKA69DRAFT_1129247 [Paraphysoderma sedebokerense]|nr:hypothetical protein BKA69DRAFT_1129247 [Paraphysoderma sedebokerense]